MGVFEAQQFSAGEVNIVGFDFRRDFVQRQRTVRCGIDRLRLDAAKHRRTAGFVQVVMRPLADDILLAALAVAEQRHQVSLRTGGQEQGSLFTAQLCRIALEFVDRQVIAVDVVPDRGGHHLFEHGAARTGNGITT